MKKYFKILYLTSEQIRLLIAISKNLNGMPIFGKILSVIIDNLIHFIYSIELRSSTIDVKNLIIGHSVGVVLGGNGIKSNAKLHISSGVVFGRRYNDTASKAPLFVFDGDVTIGANSVLLGPLYIKGPVTIGALSLVNKDINAPGTYVGTTLKQLR